MTNKCPKCHSDNPDTQSFCGDCATPLPGIQDALHTKTLETPTAELSRGSTFAGRYEIIEELGKGGMGKVYKVFDSKIKEKIALKLIKPEISSDEKTIERFTNELKFARKIVQKNVGRMFDINEEKGTHYITMEYVEGQDLKGLISQSGQLAVRTAVSISRQICEGLSEAHKLGIVHRDLKPNNIMIDKAGSVRILDFGIARSIKAKGITGTGVMIGTPEYMSPEQVEGKEADQRSDIYSLGVILYEMVTGRVPFEGDTPFTIGMKHKGELPKNPKELNTQIPDDLNSVIMRCLEKDKEKRYQSAGEVRSELINKEKGFPTTERIVTERKPLTSKEITVTLGLKKLFIPALVIVGLAIIALVIWHPWLRRKEVEKLPTKPSIAILPFANWSIQKDQEYFCDGMTDEIIAKLSRLDGLKVIPRTSMMRYRDTEKNIEDIGQELDVEFILEGSVRKEKEKIRIVTTLINVAENSQLWSETYDETLESVFAIQDNIAEEIANALMVELTPEEKVQLLKKPTENLEAYNLYLRGRFFWNKRTKIGFNRAIEYFKQAIEKDSSYPLVYAGLADCYNLLAWYNYLPPKEALPRGKEAAEQAILIDDGLAEAHTSLAWIKLTYDWDWQGAEKEFKRAIQLSSNYATAHQWYAWLLASTKRLDEALLEARRAQELDPISLIINVDVGKALYWMRLFDQAIEQFKKTLLMEPDFPRTHRDLGQAYVHEGMYEEAIAELQKAADLTNRNPYYLQWLGYAYGLAGKQDEAMAVLNELKKKTKQEYIQPLAFAVVNIGLGNKSHALEWLQKAYEERSSELILLNVAPHFDSLRSDPKFKALLKKMGLEL